MYWRRINNLLKGLNEEYFGIFSIAFEEAYTTCPMLKPLAKSHTALCFILPLPPTVTRIGNNNCRPTEYQRRESCRHFIAVVLKGRCQCSRHVHHKEPEHDHQAEEIGYDPVFMLSAMQSPAPIRQSPVNPVQKAW